MNNILKILKSFLIVVIFMLLVTLFGTGCVLFIGYQEPIGLATVAGVMGGSIVFTEEVFKDVVDNRDM